MKRILFVDNEARVLDGLRRSLHARRSVWDARFLNGAEAAQALLATEPFDVIVSDMRVPVMDGATLLTHVQERYPSMVRIILSGYSELEAALRAVPVAHQFLTKPCAPEVLVEVIERACSLQALLSDETVRRIVGGMRSLPSQPRLYQELTRALADPESSTATIAAIIERDLAMCAKILQLVNSSFFAVPRRLATIDAAVAYLGTSMLKQLVLSVEAFRTWEGLNLPGFSLESLTEHGFLAANVASRLLPVKRDAEDAFIAAMLHDIGRLVLASEFPAQLAAMVRQSLAASRPLAAIEEETLGVSHGFIGGYLLGLWGVPYPIVEAVAHHHVPTAVPQPRFGILGAVYVADQLVHECAGPGPMPADQYRPALDEAYLHGIGVLERLPEWRDLTCRLIEGDAAAPA